MQRPAVDISVSCLLFKFITELSSDNDTPQKMNPQEQILFKKYGGKLPTHKSVLMKMQKVYLTLGYHENTRSDNAL